MPEIFLPTTVRPDVVAFVLMVAFLVRALGLTEAAVTLWAFAGGLVLFPLALSLLLNEAPVWVSVVSLCAVALVMSRLLFAVIIGRQATDAMIANVLASAVRGLFAIFVVAPANLVRRFFPPA
jgi:hypothetical protein